MRRTLLIACTLLLSCARERLMTVLPPDVWVDTYAQESASKVDVLWVVDNSFSMVDKQANLGRNFQSFIDLFTRGKIDFRIGVTTTDVFNDAGQLRGTPKVLTPTTPDLAKRFEANIKVGVGGSAYEAGLQAAQLAISRMADTNAPKLAQVEQCRLGCKTSADPLGCQAGCPGKYPVEFLRPDAYLYLVFVSDDEDKSAEEPRFFWRSFENAQGIGNDSTVTTAAIVGTNAQSTCNATVGARYLELAALTEGEVGDICDPEFATTLRKLATSAVGLRRKFALTKAPNEATLEVFIKYACDAPEDALAPCASVDRTACEAETPDPHPLVCTPPKGGADGWSYDSKQRVVYFSGRSVPYLNGEVELRYYPEGVDP